MEEKSGLYANNNDPLLRDIRILIDMLTPLVSSYRLLVGGADEFNGITLAHKSDLEDAIERADEMGDIIDIIDEKLKVLIKALIKNMDCGDEYIINIQSSTIKKEGSDDSLP